MRCEDVQQQIPDFLAQTLEENVHSEIETHLAGCESCRHDVELWSKLGALPQEQPSPALRARFEAMLESHAGATRRRGTTGWLESWWPRRPVLQLAGAMALFFVGVAAGRLLTASESRDGQLAQLRQEVHSMRELVTLSLLQQQSASERLRGVNWSYRVERPDEEVLAALLRTLQHDPNVDVRLAAADALRRFSQEPSVRQALVESLGRQKSPLVQIALIDSLVDMREQRAIDAFQQLTRDEATEQIVRQRAAWALRQLGVAMK